MMVFLFIAEGLRPSDSPTRSLARRFAGALRSRGSLAALARAAGNPPAIYEMASSLFRGASPLGLPDTLSSASAKATARPFAWLARGARSRRRQLVSHL